MRRSRSSSSAAAANWRWCSAPDWAAVKKTDPVHDDLADAELRPLTPSQRRRAARHDATIITIARTAYRRCPRTWLRGADRQRSRRQLERAARRRALACVRWAQWCGWSLGRCARQLDVDAATLAEWRRRHLDPHDRLEPTPLGAPALLANRTQRIAVLDFLALHGTQFGVAVLQREFPELARRDLACLLHLARGEADAIAAGGHYRAVTWFGAGRCWAMDHTEPPTPIDGRYRYVLTVRDLASGCTLAAHPVATVDAESTVDLLAALFACHGPPLVLKADNGPAFVAAQTRLFLHRHRVHLLLSPAYTPSYNGACEAGNGTIKYLAHRIACRHDRPACWTLDDLEAARLLANRRITDRTQTLTPHQRFERRQAISDVERERFAVTYRAAAKRRLQQLGVDPSARARSIAADALARQAIADALSVTGVITIRSRRVRLSNRLLDAG
jgi:hypothetical protein